MVDDFSQSLDRLKESFLWAAAQGGNTQDCESLIEIGADINWRAPGGDTPLLSACRRGHVETISLLLAHGADVNICGDDCMAPIHIAAKRGDYQTLNVLLDSNVNLNVRTKDGSTAMDIARAKGYDDIFARLMHVMGDAVPPSPSSSSRGSRPGTRSAAAKKRGLPSLSSPRGVPPSNGSGNSSGSGVIGSALTSLTSGSRSQNPIDFVNSFPPASTLQQSVLHASVPSSSPSPSPSVSIHTSSASTASLTPATSSSSLTAPPLMTGFAHRAPRDLLSLSSPAVGSLPASSQARATDSLLDSRFAQPSGVGPQSQLQGADAAGNIALQKLLDAEIKERRLLENKVQSLKDQVLFLTSELSNARQEASGAVRDREQLVGALDLLRGTASALSNLNVEQCEQLETQLKQSLEAVEARKSFVIQQELGMQKEQRLCVVCQEKEKSVVLLPCRHMCLCDECSANSLLEHCPLCRRLIAHRISVYS